MDRALLTHCSTSEVAWLGHHQFGSKQQRRQGMRTRVMLPVNKATVTPVKESKRFRRPENVDGEFYVDHTCINCDTCRWMAPHHHFEPMERCSSISLFESSSSGIDSESGYDLEGLTEESVFKHAGAQSAVHHQPESQEERLMALQALLSCPTSSIHTEQPPKDIRSAQASFPIAVDVHTLPEVYHTGYGAERSFAAAAYFIARPQGNILVDSPRFSESLAKQFDAMGGVRYLFLTHKDDIVGHERWQERFKCERIYHELEIQTSTEGVEIKLQGKGPWSVGPDVDLIFTPGHTPGCVSLHYKKGEGALFSGDHLCGTEDNGMGLSILKSYNKDSVQKQFENVRTLLPLNFTWLLPGHGRRRHFSSVEDKNARLEKYVVEHI